MESHELSTLELLAVLTAMETAADVYETESNRTTLADVRRTLSRRAKNTRAIASNIKKRALENAEFAKQFNSRG